LRLTLDRLRCITVSNVFEDDEGGCANGSLSLAASAPQLAALTVKRALKNNLDKPSRRINTLSISGYASIGIAT
jgi:hypothetical protein